MALEKLIILFSFDNFSFILIFVEPQSLLFNRIFHRVIAVGDFTRFVWDTLRSGRRLTNRSALFFKQCEQIGVTSTGIVFTAAVFLGCVLGYQLYVSFKFFHAEGLVGGVTGASLFRELGPTMTAIMLTGRAGAAMAAQIATMRITEQIDALEVMAVDPYEYLVAPRVLAGFLMTPLLSILFCVVGSLAAAAIACGVMDLSPATYWKQFAHRVDSMDIIHCVTKAAVYGLVFTWVGCYYGFRAQGGAGGVGRATRNTVVASCLAILLSDYIVTALLPYGFGVMVVE